MARRRKENQGVPGSSFTKASWLTEEPRHGAGWICLQRIEFYKSVDSPFRCVTLGSYHDCS